MTRRKGGVSVGIDKFIEDEVTKLRKKAAEVGRYGPMGESLAATLSEAATMLEADFGAWWLAELPVSVAALECGYSEANLRRQCGDGKIAFSQDGPSDHIRIPRHALPRKARQPAEAATSPAEERIARLLGDAGRKDAAA